jgi:hypothetical protein
MKAKSIFLSTVLLMFAAQLFGGGIHIDSKSVTLNGYACGAFFLPRQSVLMKYIATDYSYSGDNYEYFLFKFAVNVKIEQSVGFNGVNAPKDVNVIQHALKSMGFYSKTVDGVYSTELAGAIKDFQLKNGLGQDGKVDPKGATIQYLSVVKPIYFLQAARDHKSRGDQNKFSFELKVNLPGENGNYTLLYHRFPIFAYNAVGIKSDGNEVILDNIARQEIQKHLSKYPYAFEEFCTVNTGTQETEAKTGELYLKLNGKVPGQQKLELENIPAHFSWYTRNITKESKALFRFRLHPTEEWSYWQTAQTADYYIINKGAHEFQVEAKYTEAGEEKITNQARFSFFLEKPFLAEPDGALLKTDEITFIDKGEVVRGTKNPKEVINQVYDRSTALIIGVDSYDDPTWVRLPYVSNDLKAVKDAFSKMGFSVKSPVEKKRVEISNEVRSAIMSAGRNDRLVIYISSHGFLDLITNKPMIASKDCYKNNPGNCLNISELKDLIKGAEKKVRHILLILDCCTSGVGVIDKNASLGGMKSLATQNGIHVLAAGMSDQNAKMSEQFKMSVFTYFLTKGLQNKVADYTKDGIVTLTELLIYVQYNVANYTKSEQVPSWGRVSGFGEMIFE